MSTPAIDSKLSSAAPTATQITYRHTPPSEALNALIHEQVLKLDEFKDRIVECRVIIDQASQHHRNHLRVEVILMVPGKEMVASAEPHGDASEGAAQTILDAFHAIRRQLVEHVQRTRHETKSHPGPGHSQTRHK